MILRSNPNYYLSHSKSKVYLTKKIFLRQKSNFDKKNAHFTDEIVFWLTLRIKEKLEIDQFLTDLTYYNLFLDSRHCSF